MRRRPDKHRSGRIDRAREAAVERIARFQEEIAKAQDYLANGKHADSRGFRPWFNTKVKDGRELPPHRDWVNNVFIRRKEQALWRAEKLLGRLT
jgi:hypothetical protein